MAKKKANGEGSIVKRTDGRWMARLSLPGGKRKAFYGATKDDVRRQLTAALSNRDRNIPVVAEKQTVKQFLTYWLEGVAGTVRPRTHLRYEQYVRLHIVPELGALAIARLTPQHVQRLYAKKLEEKPEEKKLSPTTVSHIHAVLHRALGQALSWGVVGRNVADLVKAPRLARKEMHTLTPEQAKKLLTTATDDRLHALYVLALSTGMRQGELLALRWAEVDLDRHTVQVRASLQRTKDGFVFAEPKTARSRRLIQVPKSTAEALARHRARQNAERLRMGPDWDDGDLVFCNEVGRPLEAGNVLRRSFWPLLTRAELPRIRFHELRHTAATLLLHQGVHPKVVQEMLGHSQIAVTLDLYSHVTPTLQRQAADAMEAILG